MKIALSIYNINTLKITANLIDSAVLMIPKYSLIYEENFNLNEALEFCNKNKIEPIISLNRIFLEEELEDIKCFIQKYSNYKFAVADLGVIQIMKELGLINQVIYDCPTMVCNSLDLEVYNKFGFSAISMSNEIPLEDVISSYRKTKAKIYYQVFGLKPMFYSKRRLLTLYENHSGEKFERNSLCIKEEKRNELMPIEETKNGYVVFRSYSLSFISELRNLLFMEYFYFESLRLKDEVIEGILRIYKDYLDNNLGSEEANKMIKELGVNTQIGFEYSDSIHMKEKIINE